MKKEKQVKQEADYQNEINHLKTLYDKDEGVVGESPEKQRRFEDEFRKIIEKQTRDC